MSSTNFNIGLADDNRNSSRVIKPPGGGHTDLFGPSELPPQKTGRRYYPNSVTSDFQNNEKSVHPVESSQGTNASVDKEEPMPTKITINNETDKAVGVEATQNNASEAPKRTRVPPGGFSSGFW